MGRACSSILTNHTPRISRGMAKYTKKGRDRCGEGVLEEYTYYKVYAECEMDR